MSEEGKQNDGNLPPGDNAGSGGSPDNSFPRPYRVVAASHSSHETRAAIEAVREEIACQRSEIELIRDSDTRDSLIVYKQVAALWLSNLGFLAWFTAHCIFAWHGKELPVPEIFVVAILSPYLGATMEKIFQKDRKR